MTVIFWRPPLLPCSSTKQCTGFKNRRYKFSESEGLRRGTIHWNSSFISHSLENFVKEQKQVRSSDDTFSHKHGGLQMKVLLICDWKLNSGGESFNSQNLDWETIRSPKVKCLIDKKKTKEN